MQSKSILAATLLGALAMSGCTTPTAADLSPFETTRVEADALDPAGALGALYFSPQTQGFANGANHGYLVLFDEEGAMESFRHAGMDNAKMRWEANGLHFVDRQNDYLLDETLSITPSEKTDLQEALFVDKKTGRSIGLYNKGFTKTGYTETVVETRDGAANAHSVEGAYWVSGQCNSTVIGVAEASGEHAPNEKNGHRKKMILAQLFPAVAGGEKVLGSYSTKELLQFSSDAPCKDNVLYYLSMQVPSEDQASRGTPMLVSWDAADGNRHQHPLTDSNGVPLEMTVDDFIFSTYDSGSISNGALRWFAANGSVLSTDLKDGVTTELITTDSAVNSSNEAQAKFVGDHLYVLDVPNDDLSKMITLNRYDLLSGKKELLSTIPELNEVRSEALILRQFAVKPQDH